jgi:hypothetical protein
MKNIIDKAKQYIDLTNMEASGSKLSSDDITQVKSLRRELAARGLDPQHIVGLDYRALVFAHKAAVQNFVDMHDSDRRRAAAMNKLQGFGITPDKQRLERMLAEFKQNAKEIGKRKSSKKNISLARKQADLNLANISAEISAEDARIATAASAIGLTSEEFKELAAYCRIDLFEFVAGIEEFIAAENAKRQREAMATESFTSFAADAI